MNSLEEVQKDVSDRLITAFVEPVIEQSWPDPEKLPRDERGNIKPYISYQFGDLQAGRLKNMATNVGDDYELPLYVLATGPTPEIVRRLANKVVETLLGYSTEWTGQIRKRPGGNMWPIASSDNTVQAMVYPASFGIPIQFHVNS